MLVSADEAVKKFIVDVGLPFNKAPEALGLSAKEFMNWWAGVRPSLIQNRQLQKLGQYLSIDESEIVENRYDRNLVRARIFQGAETLPERYS